jgi:hypothetical protein
MQLNFRPLPFNDEFTEYIDDPQTVTISDLYQRVKDHYGLDFTRVCLICKGKDLLPDHTLSEYDFVQDQEVIWIVFLFADN